MTNQTPALAPDEHFGRKLGKYEILCRISTGGMSEIFLASQEGAAGFRKFVVLKQILPDLRGEQEFLRMFLREAKITAALNHPNLAQVFDLGVDRGELFIVMEYVHGVTLLDITRAFRQQGQRMPIGLACAAARDTANALHYVHAFKNPAYRVDQVVHRDVAEKNVMITFDGGTKLLDFGIAKTLSGLSRTSSGVVKGTPGYIAPEQIRGERPSPLSDIFSLGVVLYHCLTDVLLFKGDTVMEQMNATLTGDIPAPSAVNPEVPAALDAVVLKALERDPSRRFQTAQELSDAIEDACGAAVWRTSQVHGLLQRLFPGRAGDWQKILAMVPDDDVTDRTGIIVLQNLLARSEVDHHSPDDESWAEVAGGPARPVRTADDAIETPSNLAAVFEPTMVAARAPRLDAEAPEGTLRQPARQLPDMAPPLPEEERTLSTALDSPGTLVLPPEVRTEQTSLPSDPGTVVRAAPVRRHTVERHRKKAQLMGGAIIAAALAVSAVVHFADTSDADAIPEPIATAPDLAGPNEPGHAEPPAVPPQGTLAAADRVDGAAEERTSPQDGAPASEAAEAAEAGLEAPAEAPQEAAPEDEEETARSDGDAEPKSPQEVGIAKATTRSTSTSTRRVNRETTRRETSGTATRKAERARSGTADNGDQGFLSLSTDISALVLLKSRRLGRTPLTRVPLPPGRHVLKLRASGNRIRRMTVLIRAGKPTVLKVRLTDLADD